MWTNMVELGRQQMRIKIILFYLPSCMNYMCKYVVSLHLLSCIM